MKRIKIKHYIAGKAVKEIMADPMKAKELIVRQDNEWINL